MSAIYPLDSADDFSPTSGSSMEAYIFHKTILNEFCQVAFRKKIYATLVEMQADLDVWIDSYNYERTHQGKMCCGRTPMATFEDGKRISQDKNLNLN